MTDEKEAVGAPGGSSVYGAFIADELDALRLSKDSLEQRAIAVVTTSGVLVALLFGLSAVVTSKKNYQLPTAAQAPLIIALFAFVAAALLALIANAPRKYRTPSARGLELIRTEHWDESGWVAERRVAGSRIEMIGAAKKENGAKARLLTLAVGAEVAAILALSVAVAIIVRHG